tara:strand:+ start:345 stop:530 length:186 start_codon:yes stop_codon:yes gene_type:complete
LPIALRVRDTILSYVNADVEMIEGRGGIFDISLNGNLKFSKLELGRYPEDNEVKKWFSDGC